VARYSGTGGSKTPVGAVTVADRVSTSLVLDLNISNSSVYYCQFAIRLGGNQRLPFTYST